MSPPKSSQNHYDVLGVDRTANPDQIKRAYRSKARQSHPDKGGDANTMMQINHAFDILGDPTRRAFYDLTGADREPDIDKEARAVLLQFISDGLTKDVSDLLAHAKGLIERNLIEFANADKLNQKAKEKLEARKIKYTKKKSKKRGKHSGDDADAGSLNIFHILIDQQISHINAGLEMNLRGRQVVNRASEMLDEYKSSEEIESMTWQTFGTISATTGRW